MTLPKLMPDEVGIVAFKDGTYDCYPNLANVPPSTSYTRTDLYTAACAERDALREFQAEIVRVYFDPTISEIETQAAIHRMLREAQDALAAYKKHKGGE